MRVTPGRTPQPRTVPTWGSSTLTATEGGATNRTASSAGIGASEAPLALAVRQIIFIFSIFYLIIIMTVSMILLLYY